MASLERKREAKRRLLDLLDDEGLPQPDEIEFGETCIGFLWHDSKLAVVVDLDELEAGAA